MAEKQIQGTEECSVPCLGCSLGKLTSAANRKEAAYARDY